MKTHVKDAGEKKRMLRHGPVWWSRIKHRWTALVWMAAAGAAVFLGFTGARVGPVSGVVEIISEDIGSVEPSRLSAVLVSTGQEVKPGEVVAQLDATLLDAQLAVEEALYKETGATVDTLQRDVLQMDRQFSTAAMNAERTLNDHKMQMAQSKAELEVLDTELKRLEDLYAKRLVDAQSVSIVRARQAALARAVEMYPEFIRATESHLEEAKSRHDSLKTWMETGDAPLSNAVSRLMSLRRDLHESQISFVTARRNGYTLRSKAGGIVSGVLHQPGDVVAAADPIVRIVGKPKLVVAFVEEANAHVVSLDMPARVGAPGAGSKKYPAKVVSLAPEMDIVPIQMGTNLSRGIRGRRILVELLTETDFLPGEAVQVYFGQRTWPFEWLKKK